MTSFQGYLNLCPSLPRTLLHLKLQAKAGLYGFLELATHLKTHRVISLTRLTWVYLGVHYLTHTMTSFLGWPQRVDHCTSSGLSLVNRCVGILFHLCWCSLSSGFVGAPRFLLQTLLLRAKILPKTSSYPNCHHQVYAKLLHPKAFSWKTLGSSYSFKSHRSKDRKAIHTESSQSKPPY